jgi:hypothetical protein
MNNFCETHSNSEDAGSMFLRNVGIRPQNYDVTNQKDRRLNNNRLENIET